MNKITSYELSTALDELRQTLGKDFTLNENGACYLNYQNELPILIQYLEEEQRLVLGAEFLGELENAPGEDWLAALSWNWMGIQSHGCALSPDFKSGTILIWRDVRSYPLNGQNLTEEMADFLSDVLVSKKAFAEANLAAK
jgi:hypothetical protein